MPPKDVWDGDIFDRGGLLGGAGLVAEDLNHTDCVAAGPGPFRTRSTVQAGPEFASRGTDAANHGSLGLQAGSHNLGEIRHLVVSLAVDALLRSGLLCGGGLYETNA